jgi:hypothetical protein
MDTRELEDAVKQATTGIGKLRDIGDVLYYQENLTVELLKSFNLFNKKLLSLAPLIAHSLHCEDGLVEFIKVMVEDLAYEPEIRDCGFFFPLSIAERKMTWAEYLGEEHGENVAVAPLRALPTLRTETTVRTSSA